MANAVENTVTPAYIPYKTFSGFVGNLKASGAIPGRIDKSLLSTYSGSSQSQLMTSLRFLRLIGADDAVKESLRDLIEAHGDEEAWKKAVLEILLPAYTDLLGDLDIDTATSAELDERFRNAGATGSVLIKASRFFLKLLEEAEMTYSPHFKSAKAARIPTTSRKKPRRARRPDKQGEDNKGASRDESNKTPEGMIEFPIHFGPSKPTGKIQVPKSMNETDMAMFKAMVAAVEAYAAQQSKGGD